MRRRYDDQLRTISGYYLQWKTEQARVEWSQSICAMEAFFGKAALIVRTPATVQRLVLMVLAKRKEGSGKVKVLLHWTPEDILPDVWVNETERSQLKTKVVHLSQLPQETAMMLDPNIYRALPQKRLKRSL